MALIRIAALAELPPESLLQRTAGGTPVALCHHAGKIHAFNGLCPHLNGPLGHGNLADGRIVCPWHGWEFDVETGALDFNPRVRLQRYGVEVRDGAVFVDVP